jgi:hypothetical protein
MEASQEYIAINAGQCLTTVPAPGCSTYPSVCRLSFVSVPTTCNWSGSRGETVKSGHEARLSDSQKRGGRMYTVQGKNTWVLSQCNGVYALQHTTAYPQKKRVHGNL